MLIRRPLFGTLRSLKQVNRLGCIDFLSVQLIFRTVSIIFGFIIVLLFPKTLPRSRAFYLWALTVLTASNAAIISALPRASRLKVRFYLWLDLILSASLVLSGGGWGNVLIFYAYSSVLSTTLEAGPIPGAISAALLSICFLASLIFPPSTIVLLKGGEYGTWTIISWALSYFIIMATAELLRRSGVMLLRSVDRENSNLMEISAIKERLRLAEQTRKRLSGTLTLAHARLTGLADEPSIDLDAARKTLSEIGLRLDEAARQMRQWISSIRKDAEPARENEITSACATSFRKEWVGHYEDYALKILLAYRVFSLAYALAISLGGGQSNKPRVVNIILVISSLIYCSVFYYMSEKRFRHRRLILISVDLLYTGSLLSFSGGHQSHFFIYSFSTAALGAIWLDLAWAVLIGLMVGFLYFLSLQVNGFTQQVLSHIGDARNIPECIFEYVLASLVTFVILERFRQSFEAKRRLGITEAELASYEERLRIVRDLHDGLLQDMAAAYSLSSLIEDRIMRRVSMNAGDLQHDLYELDQIILGSLQSIDALSSDPGPRQIPVGISEMISSISQGFSKKTGITVTMESSEDSIDASADLADDLSAILAELFANVAKHSGATHVRVRLSREDDLVRLTIEDNGKGFVPEEMSAKAVKGGHFGLLGIRERASRIGCNISVSSAAGRGTTAVLELPACKRGDHDGKGR